MLVQHRRAAVLATIALATGGLGFVAPSASAAIPTVENGVHVQRQRVGCDEGYVCFDFHGAVSMVKPSTGCSDVPNQFALSVLNRTQDLTVRLYPEKNCQGDPVAHVKPGEWENDFNKPALSWDTSQPD